MDLYEVMRTTPAVREFTGDPIPDDVLMRILDHARFAPSGGNRQGAHLVLVRDHHIRVLNADSGELNKPAVRRYVAQIKAGQSPWNALEPPAPSQDEIDATDVPAQFTEPVLRAAVVVVVLVDLGVVAAMDQDLERVGIVGGASVYPLVWNVLLAARNEGFGGTITTMASAEEAGVRELLGVPERYAVAAVLPLGKPVRQLTRLKRQPIEEFVTWDRYDGDPFGGQV